MPQYEKCHADSPIPNRTSSHGDVSSQFAALTDGFRDSDDGDRYFLFSEFFVEKVRPSMRPITTCHSTRRQQERVHMVSICCEYLFTML